MEAATAVPPGARLYTEHALQMRSAEISALRYQVGAMREEYAMLAGLGAGVIFGLAMGYWIRLLLGEFMLLGE